MVLRRRRALFATLVVAAALATIAGCAYFAIGGRRDVFRHDVHAARRITCDACHLGDVTAEGPGMPSYRECLACHGASAERGAFDYERSLQQHEPGERFVAKLASFDLRPVHAVHAAHGVDCESCHRAALFDAMRSRSVLSPKPDDCSECHRLSGAGGDCATCHRELARDARPPSHAAASWMRAHGRDSRFAASGPHREGCELCHARSDCDTCHRTERPQDHGELFRTRTHGYEAELDRERCATCHQETFCVRCHEESRPLDHGATWGGRASRHCLSCHEPIGASRCSVCHRSTASHLDATAIPGPPHPTARDDCRRCHLRPPHPDDGSNCQACHR